MIIIRSPLRISFFGGGTDMKKYYKNDYGCVLGHAITKYVYVIINSRFENELRISYLNNEIVSDIKKIKHKLIQASLKTYNIKNHLELVTVGDIPGTGTGLGSSSSLAVGLINALSNYSGKSLSKKTLAEKASDLEINQLHSPIGKQDQYFSSYGGLLFIRFNKDDSVKVERIKLNNKIRKELENNILAFYTGLPRSTNNVLKKSSFNVDLLNKMRDFAEKGRDYLKNGNLEDFSLLFSDYWNLKKSVSKNTSNPTIDYMFKKAIDAGATGGKVSGAGNGGFVFFYCKPKYQKKLRHTLRKFPEIKFNIDELGSNRLF